MSGEIVYRKYSVWCNTENSLVTTQGFLDYELTTCPNDVAHDIITTSITIVDTLVENSVTIKDRTDDTGGSVQFKGYILDVPAVSGINNITFTSPKINTRVAIVIFYPSESNVGDTVSVFAAPNTTIGVLTATLSTGTNVLHVSNTVLAYIKIGYYVRITNGVTVDELSYVVDINLVDHTITTDHDATADWSAGCGVQMSIPRMTDFYISSIARIETGIKHHGTVFLPANTQFLLLYNNVSGVAKKIVFNLEMYY